MQQSPPAQPRRADEPLPEAREVAPGIWKITLPIPFPLRTVNVYALVGEDGWTLIDAGIGTPDARAAFAAGLERAGLSIAGLKTILLTHHHPDHIGLSGELQAASGAPVYMHQLDEQGLRIIWDGSMPERFNSVSTFFRQHGLEYTPFWYTQADPQALKTILSVPPHEVFTLLEDGALLELAGEQYRVIWVPGHSDGLITLFRPRDGVYLAADHVLPRITPNIGLYSTYDRPNPLDDYLHSLRKVENLTASLVLPGHGEPFPDLAGRVHEIILHHEEREGQILALLEARPQHATDLTHQLFPSRRIESGEALRMAVAEVLAHLEYMRYAGKVVQQREAQEIILYTTV